VKRFDSAGPPKLPPEDRALRREAVVLLAFLRGADGEAITQGVARTLDISPRGAGLVAPRPVRVGVRVHLELLLPSKLRLESRGAVVHVSDAGVGQWRLGIAFDAPPQLTAGLTLAPPDPHSNLE